MPLHMLSSHKGGCGSFLGAMVLEVKVSWKCGRYQTVGSECEAMYDSRPERPRRK